LVIILTRDELDVPVLSRWPLPAATRRSRDAGSAALAGGAAMLRPAPSKR